MNTKELIKNIKIEDGCSYLIFVSSETGLSKYDLEMIPIRELGAKDYRIVYVNGNVAELIKVVKVSDKPNE